MRGLFNPDNPVMIFLRKVADLLIGNLLWIICSIPIITIGASTTALYHVCFKVANNEEPSVCKTFMKAFKENFKQATIIWIMFLFVLVYLGVDIYVVFFIPVIGNGLRLLLLFVLLILAITLISMFTYVFALQSYFENTLKNTLKNAVMFGLAYYVHTITMVVFDVVAAVLGLIYCPFIIPAAPLFINTLIIRGIFEKYMEQQ